MNLSLKPHPLIAHWVPGFVLLLMILLSAFDWRYESLIARIPSELHSASLIIFALAVLAFVSGQFLDAVRNGLIEECWDYCEEKRQIQQLNWGFFFDGDEAQLKHLHEHYFTWYVANLNLSLAIVFGGAVSLVLALYRNYPWHLILPVTIGIVAVIVIFMRDASGLRKEIKDNINRCYTTK